MGIYAFVPLRAKFILILANTKAIGHGLDFLTKS